ncbi:MULTISPECIES: hypothetical protein [unclassified Bosea (in: a-proteobacteria)]|uniref:hypothetical protein n=1 Tax=unclassified Bosea (in: a-proteobacteria) TaxID=2653178 RepID=UPI0012534E8B|nr:MULTISPECIES: hypothetical protein [unclassified Bosea (in: a-proteobacteria)]CAD5286397.1 conserved hypothetical protein [Bosea sp. 21B]VVT60569.1 conserved hypothetical protein [Bosea sp. EC-HK365B]
MKLYSFASDNLTNIWAGIGAGLWAVGESDDSTFVKGRITKADRMPIGAFGILYCNETRSLTVPFVVYSKADPERTESQVWSKSWVLPFLIKPLGTPRRQLSRDRAREILLSLSGKRFESLFLVQGQFAFQATDVADEDWAVLIRELAE